MEIKPQGGYLSYVVLSKLSMMLCKRLHTHCSSPTAPRNSGSGTWYDLDLSGSSFAILDDVSNNEDRALPISTYRSWSKWHHAPTSVKSSSRAFSQYDWFLLKFRIDDLRSRELDGVKLWLKVEDSTTCLPATRSPSVSSIHLRIAKEPSLFLVAPLA